MLKNKLYQYGGDNILVPAHMHFGLLLMQRCEKSKERVALLDGDTGASITYGELAQIAVDIALSLTRIGVKRGDVVGICSEKRMEFMAALMGISCAGATFSPADMSCRNERIMYRINLVKPKVIFCSPAAYKIHKHSFESAESIQKIIVFSDHGENSLKEFLTEHADVSDFLPTPVEGWTDIAASIFSSGTTGMPKPVPLTHYQAIIIFQNAMVEELYEGKVMLSTREWYFTYGLKHTLGALLCGTTVVYTNCNTLQDYVEAIAKYRVNIIQVVPTTINEFLKSPVIDQYDLTSLEMMMSTSTPISGELIDAVKKRFPNLRSVLQIYGMTEAGCVIANMLTSCYKAESCGKVCARVVMKVVDVNTRAPLGANKRGELCLQAASLMYGYIGDTTFDYFDEEGFFKTGDIGYYDEEGYFYIVDRIKDMIKYYGASISPAEIESVLLQHPAVCEAGVVGVPHPLCGEAPTALVVLQPGAIVREDELIKMVDEQLQPSVSLVGGVKFVSHLPRVPNGKIDRKALLQMLW